MGASGYRDHIVVCGWNSTARELIQELSTDEYTTKIVVIHDDDKNPAGEGVYFVSGDITTGRRPQARRHRGGDGRGGVPGGRLQRGRHEVDPVRDGDRVARAAGADRRRGQQPRARRALPARRGRRDPGLLPAGLPADGPLVALPGAGRDWSPTSCPAARAPSSTAVQLPDNYVGLSVDELSAKLRAEHRATLLSVSRSGQSYVNPPEDFRLAPGDDLVVVAESLGELAPLEMDHDIGSQYDRLGTLAAQPGRTPAIDDVRPALPRHRQRLGGVDVGADDPCDDELEWAGVHDRQRPFVVAPDLLDDGVRRVRRCRCPAPGRWWAATPGRRRRRTRGRRRCRR